jgi:hypothetical protein
MDFSNLSAVSNEEPQPEPIGCYPPVNEVPWEQPTRRQVGGTHYNSRPIQPFDIIATLDLDFFEGSTLKYLMRYRHKGGAEDLEKAKHYIDILIAREKGVKEWWKV